MEHDTPFLYPLPPELKNPDDDRDPVLVAKAIDVHVDVWYELVVQSNELEESDPNRHRTNLSRIILSQCTALTRPPEEIITAIAARQDPPAKNMGELAVLISNQNRLAAVARDPEFDHGEIELPIMARSFMFVDMVRHNPNSSPNLIEALNLLRNLYVAREQIALRQNQDLRVFMQEAGKFSWVLKKIIDEN